MKKTEFLRGLYGGIPICLGYLSVSFAFGIFAVESGLTVWQALLLSATCVTSAGQLAAVPIIVGGGSLMELAISQLVINLRYSLMSISLSQKFDRFVGLFDRFAIAFVNTDEVFAVASGQKGTVGKWFMYGLTLTPWLGWAIGTLLGAVAGNILPAIVTSALGVAIAHSGDKAARLVEHYVAVLGARHNNPLAADKDLVLVCHLVAEDRGLAVDLDLALQNQLLSLSARRDAALSQKFL